MAHLRLRRYRQLAGHEDLTLWDAGGPEGDGVGEGVLQFDGVGHALSDWSAQVNGGHCARLGPREGHLKVLELIGLLIGEYHLREEKEMSLVIHIT